MVLVVIILCPTFGMCWVFIGAKGVVANLKTVPIYQGVTDVFLRSSCTDPDGLQLLGDPSSYCVIALCVTE